MADPKNPLHPSALTINQVQPGRRYIQFNRALGIVQEGVFLARPFAGHRFSPASAPHLQVRVRTTRGWAQTMFLGDLGIVPYGDTLDWNNTNFTIDARKQHLLPPRDEELHARQAEVLEGWDWDFEPDMSMDYW